MSLLLKKLRFSSLAQSKLSCYIFFSNHVHNDVKEVNVRKTITSQDVAMFSNITGDYNPVHEKIVHGAFLNGLVSGVMGTQLPGPGTVLISQEMHFPNPCFVGSCVLITVVLKDSRKIMTCEFKCATEDGKIVLYGHAKVMKKFPSDT